MNDEFLIELAKLMVQYFHKPLEIAHSMVSVMNHLKTHNERIIEGEQKLLVASDEYITRDDERILVTLIKAGLYDRDKLIEQESPSRPTVRYDSNGKTI